MLLAGSASWTRAPARGGEASSHTSAGAERPEPRAVAECKLTGTLCDQHGRALQGLELELRECPTAGDRACWGDALAGLSASESLATVAGGADGSFAFVDVPEGGWALFVRGSHEVPQAVYFFRIAADQRARHLPLVLARGLRLRGRVLGPGGEPVTGAQLVAAGLDASFHQRARSSDDGTFTLGPLLEGRYRLEANGAEHHGTATGVVFAGEEVEVQLEPGGVLDVCIRDEVGLPVTVQLLLQGATTRTAAGSRIRLARLTPGLHELLARTTDGRMAVQRLLVEPGVAPVPMYVVVRPACELQLRLAGSEPRSWRARWNDTVVAEGTLDPGGETRVLLPPGPVSVSWSNGTEDLAEHVDERVLGVSEDPVVIEYEARTRALWPPRRR